MKREQLKEGLRCRVTKLIADNEGAVYKDEVVSVVDWSDVSKDRSAVVVFVQDEIGKHHTVGLNDIEPL